MQTQQWMPPQKPPTLPTEPREYPAFWRAPGIAWWKPVVAALAGAVGFLVLSLIVSAAALLIESVISQQNLMDVLFDVGEGIVTPTVFMANSVSLGLLVPLSFLLSRLVGQKGGWLSSVVGRIRWRWLLKCFVISFIAVAGLVLFAILVEGWDQQEFALRPGWQWLLIGVIIVTPFQAAGEEYLIRGVLNRAVGSFIPARVAGAVIAAVVSSTVFMFLHFADDIWLNITYFSMGMLFSYLAWRTGGLEAAVAMHAANNMVALLFLPFQDISEVFDRTAGASGPTALLSLGLLGIAAVIIVQMARRSSLARTGPPDAVAGRVR